ncbi:MAG: hypothetical protein HC895_16275, partial [Leptolyngbyaceae cyanobacterium SM1_3_5]|nr:hypothetical protein [Leptolyngbyaceae cyanobacterium SM1_3_5]
MRCGAFFENGGQVCYVVRASNGKYAAATLEDASGNEMIKVRSRQPGNPSAAIQVALATTRLLPASSLYQPTASYTALNGRQITLTDAAAAAQFRPGDGVTLGSGGERLQLSESVAIFCRLLAMSPEPTTPHPIESG